MDDAGSAMLRRWPRKSAFLAAVLGWILPGLGQAYVGRPGKGLYFFAVVLATYAAGLLLADFRCVSPDREPVWFAAQVLAAAPTAAVAWLTRDLDVVRRVTTYDAGILYCAVAALLNAVVVADALGTVDEIDREAAAGEEEAHLAHAEAEARRVESEEAARAAAAAEPAAPEGLGVSSPSPEAFPAGAPPADLAAPDAQGDGTAAAPADEPGSLP